MQLDVESLRTFMTVLELGTMTRAAEKLNLSQSAVSWKIKRLEERVGRSLLLRNGRTLTPTRDGRELLDYAQTIVDTHDAAVARLTSSELTGTVKIGASEEVTAMGMASLLGRFTRLHPGASVEFLVEYGTGLNQLLAQNALDVAVMQVAVEEFRPTDALLWTNELVWVTAADWTYSEGEVPLITFGRSDYYRPLAERLLRQARIPYRIAFSAPSSASVLAAVEAGLGVAVLAAMSLDDVEGSATITEWPRSNEVDALPPTYQVARPAPGGELSPLTAELITHIEAELSDEATS